DGVGEYAEQGARRFFSGLGQVETGCAPSLLFFRIRILLVCFLFVLDDKINTACKGDYNY
ncbi:MAG: hypothetical protein LBB64_04685, partial [Dysgonamonadaceae bacterium]|nr:hypothetical protein [Dysgonamonadaceae bacterium]